VAALLTHQASACFLTGAPPPRLGNGHLSIVPYDMFLAADGAFVLAVGNDDQWRRFCAVTGLDDLAEDPRFRTNPDRVRHRDALRPILARTFLGGDRAEWIAALRSASVPCGPVRNVAEALADPQLEAREMIATVPHPTAGALRVVGNPIRLSNEHPNVLAPPPTLGEHTTAILTTDLGLGADEVQNLRAREVI
jgi:crotonobetainyl-CoA:carnitine CoA-transferase CaiB-like acyl-CoA transferase